MSLLLFSIFVGISSIQVKLSNSEQNLQEIINTSSSIDRSSWHWTEIDILSIASGLDSDYPEIEVDSSNNVHVVWSDPTDYPSDGDGDGDIFYKCWNSSTKLWQLIEMVSSESDATSFTPSLDVDLEGNVYVTWVDNDDILGSGIDQDIFFKKKNMITDAWSSAELISTGSNSASSSPCILLEHSNVHITWGDLGDITGGSGGDKDLFYKKWDAASSTWEAIELISIQATDNSDNSQISVDDEGNLHVIWSDYTDYLGAGADVDIWYNMRDSSTETWDYMKLVSTESSLSSVSPDMTMDSNGDIHVTWADTTNYDGSGVDRDIFYKRWDSTLGIWTYTLVVSVESTDESTYPRIIVDQEDIIHITWIDATNYASVGTDRDVFYKHWIQDTDVWSDLIIVAPESTSSVDDLALAVDTLGHIHFTWVDPTNYKGANADDDIFYRRFVGPPEAPILAPIIPNPNSDGMVILDWTDAYGATEYYVYRSSSYIWSSEGLSPIISYTSSWINLIATEDIYYYAVVAVNDYGSSQISNCVSVEVVLSEETDDGFLIPNELLIVGGIIVAAQVIIFVVTVLMLMRIRSSVSRPKKKK